MYTTRRANYCKLIDVIDRHGTAPRALAIALSFALASAAALEARAQAPSAEGVADARLNEAKRKFEDGVRAFAERRYADAAQSFREADAIQPSPALSFNIARSYERLEDPPAALRWYRDYQRRSPQATNRAEVEARVVELSRTLEARGVQQVSVLVEPAGAEVLIDARPPNIAPFTTELQPGKHHVTVRARGYADRELDFELEARTPRDVTITLEPLGATTPSAVIAPSTATNSGPAAPAPPVMKKRPFGIAPWIVLGAGAASTLGALGFELARRSAESDAEQSDQLGYPGHFDTMHGRQTTARILAVTGGLLLIGGGTLWVLNKPREPSRTVALGCTSSGCAIAASGSFE